MASVKNTADPKLEEDKTDEGLGDSIDSQCASVSNHETAECVKNVPETTSVEKQQSSQIVSENAKTDSHPTVLEEKEEMSIRVNDSETREAFEQLSVVDDDSKTTYTNDSGISTSASLRSSEERNNCIKRIMTTAEKIAGRAEFEENRILREKNLKLQAEFERLKRQFALYEDENRKCPACVSNEVRNLESTGDSSTRAEITRLANEINEVYNDIEKQHSSFRKLKHSIASSS